MRQVLSASRELPTDPFDIHGHKVVFVRLVACVYYIGTYNTCYRIEIVDTSLGKLSVWVGRSDESKSIMQSSIEDEIIE